jgi:hypothetical protein
MLSVFGGLFTNEVAAREPAAAKRFPEVARSSLGSMDSVAARA